MSQSFSVGAGPQQGEELTIDLERDLMSRTIG